MSNKLKFFSTYYQCPSCWLDFKDTNSRYLPQYFNEHVEKFCEFCEKKPPALDVLKRQIEFLQDMQPLYLSYFLQNLAKHVELKD